MSELTDVNAILQRASDTFRPITAKPRDADLQRLNETLVVCILSVTLTGTTDGCASGVVLPEAVYQTNHGGDFDFMHKVRPKYDPDIERLSKDNRLSKMQGMEHNWADGTANQSLICAVEVGV